MKKFTLTRVLAMILCISILLTSLPTIALAFKDFQVEVTKDNAPLREGYYESEDVIRRLEKGTILTVVGEQWNWRFNLWYKIKGGGYIYSGNVKEIHVHNYKFKKYESLHPHLASYECSCGSGYCSTETKKVKGCEECYPHVHDYKFKRYESLHPHLASYECSCGSGYCSTETQKVDDCEECYPHQHDYQHVGYESQHPHLAKYECDCGSGYCTDETIKDRTCEICYPVSEVKQPEHEHAYTYVGREATHPHRKKFVCNCGESYKEESNVNFEGCKVCELENYGGDELVQDLYRHTCEFEFTGEYQKSHPHYAITSCIICGAESINKYVCDVVNSCFECTFEQSTNIDKHLPKPFNIYNFETNEVVTLSEEQIAVVFSGSDVAHFGLDACGLAPGVGAVCDGVNVAYYLIEGKYVDAGLSAISLIPFAGLVTGAGKVIKKSGALIIEGSGKLFSKLTRKKIVATITNTDSLSAVGEAIYKGVSKNSTKYLKTVANISNNVDLPLEKVFFNDEVLLSGKYTGVITSPAGLKYITGSESGHRITHILERHCPTTVIANPKLTKKASNLFSVDEKKIFDIIDDAYVNYKPIPVPEKTTRKHVTYDYDLGYVIGTQGETKIRIAYESDIKTKKIVTAFPIN